MADIKYIDLIDGDSVQYHLFPDTSRFCEGGTLSLHFIDELLVNINKAAKKLSENYIWHNDEFQIQPKNLISQLQSDVGEPLSFYGSLNYGENIEDEWFLVYILVELTKLIDGLIVHVKDSDGEFLLIEAAEQLPSWVTPETCEGRTFLYKGELHILPKSFAQNNEDYRITEKVLKYIRENSDDIKCDPCIQKAIEYRISGFPTEIEENYHYAILYVPVGVASLMNANEKFIAPAIRAFCDRDLIDIKACRAMKYFPPENRVYTRVKFTKLLYAMLATSKFTPDKRTGWNLPQANDENYKSHLLGIKLACGFEILLSRSKGDGDAKGVEEVDYANDPNWKKFLKSLSSRNYFRGLLEHSQQYNQLLETAKEYYVNSCEKCVKPSKAKEILDMLNKMDVDVDELKKKELNLPKSDDDSWMNISQEELDSLLKARFGTENVNKSKDQNLEISQHLNDFINHVSGLEGAEFPKKGNDVLDSKGAHKKRKTVKFSPDTKTSDTSSSPGPASNVNNIKFETEGFLNAIRNILDFSIPDDNYWDSEGSDMSSYEDETEAELGETSKHRTAKKDENIIKYMNKMDEELSHTTIGQSFISKKTSVNDNDKNDNFEDIEEFKPVDIDVNALKNIISSYRAQMGEAGPAENLLGPLGIKLDDIETDVD